MMHEVIDNGDSISLLDKGLDGEIYGEYRWDNLTFGTPVPRWMPNFMRFFFPSFWSRRKFVNTLYANGTGKFYEPKLSFGHPAIDKFADCLVTPETEMEE